ncbi:hypothetical protein MSAN_02348500 [Mycena sanguinolenta]|uniref:DUF6534 domain-containing protein n=1 Tax=Mycena sanguinolenta TaxID=230812 RepID=A0A8H7CEY8_9AGAR|nr:hypothetical protein MSAN_02348500 [Mycena sanguinolenta]
MSTTLPRLDAITGALLIGTWASSLLYMAELLQAVYYFSNFKQDNWKLKSYVAVAFAIDTVSAVADYACVYLETITHAGDLVYLTKQNWAVPLWVISTNCVAILVQSFLAFRYWRFTNNTIIVCFLFVLILAAFGGGIYSALTIILFPAFKDRNKIRVSGIVYVVTQVSADLIIAGALVREFMRAKSSLFKGQQRRVDNMLNRLVLRTIQTGTATAMIAVLSLIVFLIDVESNIPVGILYTSGRVYILSMLTNLNIRESGRSQNSTISGGRQGAIVFAHSTAHNISSVQFCPTSASLEPESSNSGSVKSNALLTTLQSTASISATQAPEIEMVPTHTKQVPEV